MLPCFPDALLDFLAFHAYPPALACGRAGPWLPPKLAPPAPAQHPDAHPFTLTPPTSFPTATSLSYAAARGCRREYSLPASRRAEGAWSAPGGEDVRRGVLHAEVRQEGAGQIRDATAPESAGGGIARLRQCAPWCVTELVTGLHWYKWYHKRYSKRCHKQYNCTPYDCKPGRGSKWQRLVQFAHLTTAAPPAPHTARAAAAHVPPGREAALPQPWWGRGRLWLARSSPGRMQLQLHGWLVL